MASSFTFYEILNNADSFSSQGSLSARPRSTPNILDFDVEASFKIPETSSRPRKVASPVVVNPLVTDPELSLLEESISEYDEPFGKAVLIEVSDLNQMTFLFHYVKQSFCNTVMVLQGIIQLK